MNDETKPTPKLGDRRPAGACWTCQTPIFDTYQEHNAYHNSTVIGWVRDRHEAPGSCIKSLLNRLVRVEDKLAALTAAKEPA
jgi:hypothetical protein